MWGCGGPGGTIWVASRPARANPAAANIAFAICWPVLSCVATRVEDTIAAPSAAPHCRVAVSSALAVPSA